MDKSENGSTSQGCGIVVTGTGIIPRGRVMELLDVLDRGDQSPAIANLTHVIARNPSDAKVYFNRGIAYREKGEIIRAIDDFTHAIALTPNEAEIYFNRGIAYYIEDDGLGRAIADFDRAIKINPNDRMHYYLRGFCYDFIGDDARAIADYSAVMEIAPNDPDAYFFRGKIYRNTGAYDCAIADFTHAIEIYPDYTVAYYYRGETGLRQGRWNDAKTDLIIVRNMDMDIIGRFREDYKNVEEFEQKYDVKLPKDIVTMLTPEQTLIRNGNNSIRTFSWKF